MPNEPQQCAALGCHATATIIHGDRRYCGMHALELAEGKLVKVRLKNDRRLGP